MAPHANAMTTERPQAKRPRGRTPLLACEASMLSAVVSGAAGTVFMTWILGPDGRWVKQWEACEARNPWADEKRIENAKAK